MGVRGLTWAYSLFQGRQHERTGMGGALTKYLLSALNKRLIGAISLYKRLLGAYKALISALSKYLVSAPPIPVVIDGGAFQGRCAALRKYIYICPHSKIVSYCL